MEKILESEYFCVKHDAEQKMFYYVFNEKTSHMSSDEYMKEIQNFADLVEEYKPATVLGNMVDFGHSITPEVQEWVSETLFTIYEKIDFKRIAIILSKEFVESLSIQQTMDEAETLSFETAYFDNEDKAKAWLSAA